MIGLLLLHRITDLVQNGGKAWIRITSAAVCVWSNFAILTPSINDCTRSIWHLLLPIRCIVHSLCPLCIGNCVDFRYNIALGDHHHSGTQKNNRDRRDRCVPRICYTFNDPSTLPPTTKPTCQLLYTTVSIALCADENLRDCWAQICIKESCFGQCANGCASGVSTEPEG